MSDPFAGLTDAQFKYHLTQANINFPKSKKKRDLVPKFENDPKFLKYLETQDWYTGNKQNGTEGAGTTEDKPAENASDLLAELASPTNEQPQQTDSEWDAPKKKGKKGNKKNKKGDQSAAVETSKPTNEEDSPSKSKLNETSDDANPGDGDKDNADPNDDTSKEPEQPLSPNEPDPTGEPATTPTDTQIQGESQSAFTTAFATPNETSAKDYVKQQDLDTESQTLHDSGEDAQVTPIVEKSTDKKAEDPLNPEQATVSGANAEPTDPDAAQRALEEEMWAEWEETEEKNDTGAAPSDPPPSYSQVSQTENAEEVGTTPAPNGGTTENVSSDQNDSFLGVPNPGDIAQQMPSRLSMLNNPSQADLPLVTAPTSPMTMPSDIPEIIPTPITETPVDDPIKHPLASSQDAPSPTVAEDSQKSPIEEKGKNTEPIPESTTVPSRPLPSPPTPPPPPPPPPPPRAAKPTVKKTKSKSKGPELSVQLPKAAIQTPLPESPAVHGGTPTNNNNKNGTPTKGQAPGPQSPTSPSTRKSGRQPTAGYNFPSTSSSPPPQPPQPPLLSLSKHKKRESFSGIVPPSLPAVPSPEEAQEIFKSTKERKKRKSLAQQDMTPETFEDQETGTHSLIPGTPNVIPATPMTPDGPPASMIPFSSSLNPIEETEDKYNDQQKPPSPTDALVPASPALSETALTAIGSDYQPIQDMHAMVEAMRGMVGEFGVVFDSLGGKTAAIGNMAPKMEIQYHINRLARKIAEQDERQMRDIEGLKGLLHDVVQDQIISHLRRKIEDLVDDLIDSDVDRLVKEEVDKYMPESLVQTVKAQNAQLEAVRMNLENAEARRSNAGLRAERDLNTRLTPLLMSNGKVSAKFPRNMEALFGSDDKTVLALLQDYNQQSTGIREKDMNRILNYFGVHYQLVGGALLYSARLD